MATFSKATFNSALYRSFRPVYSKPTYNIIYDFHANKGGKFDHAVDIGTGTGQVAVELAEKFKHVHGTDLSAKMLEAAIPKPNIEYTACPAENLPFDDSSIDVITSAQAFHWFKHDQFFKEAKRVLKPNGTIAIIGYGFARIKGSPKASSLIEDLGLKKFENYWDAGRVLVDNLYRDIPIPFPDTQYHFHPKDVVYTENGKITPHPILEQEMTLESFRHYLKTWSSYANYMKDHPEEPVDPVEEIVSDIAQILNVKEPEQQLITVQWPGVLILATPQ
ncbi:S-adenosyl-L-methionine-dependent methyltransferase [Umbelopsis sp. PMI_123]|nr:S-adenosyl-L-methionine-dependent methyltransferase [Umbelopsis sp. PMI_123]